MDKVAGNKIYLESNVGSFNIGYSNVGYSNYGYLTKQVIAKQGGKRMIRKTRNGVTAFEAFDGATLYDEYACLSYERLLKRAIAYEEVANYEISELHGELPPTLRHIVRGMEKSDVLELIVNCNFRWFWIENENQLKTLGTAFDESLSGGTYPETYCVGVEPLHGKHYCSSVSEMSKDVRVFWEKIKTVEEKRMKTISKEEKMQAIKRKFGDFLILDNEKGINFYYSCMMAGRDLLDIDEYAMLNTLFGYDIGMENAQKLSMALWENEIDILDLNEGEQSLNDVRPVAESVGLELDYSKWRTEKIVEYSYFD